MQTLNHLTGKSVLIRIEHDEEDIAPLVAQLNAMDSCETSILSRRALFGLHETTLLLSVLGGPVVMRAIASVLVAWINKNANRSVEIGKVKITGYSADEIQKLLESKLKLRSK